MKYKVDLDENNYLIAFVNTGTAEDTVDLDIETMNIDYMNCYKLVNDEIIFDEKKYNDLFITRTKELQIIGLKKQLESTDYKAIKYAEGWISEEEYAPIKAKRESLREQIRALESNI